MEPADDNVPGAAANIPPLPPGTGRTGPLPHQLCLSDRPINSDREEFLAARAPGAAPWQSRAGSGELRHAQAEPGLAPTPVSHLRALPCRQRDLSKKSGTTHCICPLLQSLSHCFSIASSCPRCLCGFEDEGAAGFPPRWRMCSC